MSEKIYHIIGRGFNGWHAKGVNVSSSGGDIVERTYWTGERMIPYTEQAIENALVYDASECKNNPEQSSVFIKFVCNGPIIDPSLPPDGVDRFSDMDRKTALRMLPGLSGGYGTIALMAQNPNYSGLDKVGVKVYENLLREIPGIKFGKIVNGKIEWENS